MADKITDNGALPPSIVPQYGPREERGALPWSVPIIQDSGGQDAPAPQAPATPPPDKK